MKVSPPHNWRNIKLAIVGAMLSVTALSVAALYGPLGRLRAEAADYRYAADVPAKAFVRELQALRRTEAFSKAIADKAVAGVWSIQPIGSEMVWPDVAGPLDDIWSGTAVDDNTWPYALHSLEILKDLLIAHAATGDVAYIRTGEAVIRSWIANNPRSAPPCEYSWGDHTTANRAVNICAFLDTCREKDLGDDGWTAMVTRSLASHAVFLSTEAHYTFQHNHGIFQDFALMVIATHLTPADKTAAWLDLARERMARQLSETFSAGGIHLENSPDYHIAITELLARVAHYADATGAELPDRLRPILASARSAIADFVMPNGDVAPVGDSPRGRNRQAVAETAPGPFVVFGGAGYGIMRDDLYVFFAASHNARGHKHRDDLSVVVGDEVGLILTDAGFLNYDTDDPRQHYTTSWDAHNVVTFDSEPPQELSLRCGIDAFGRTDDYLYVTGRSERRGGTLRRSVLYDLQRDWIVIVDRGTSASGQPLQWRRLFHFEPDTTASASAGGAVALETPSGKSYQLTLCPAAAPELVRGQSSPMQGWVAERYGELLPAGASVETQSGSEVRFAAVLSPGTDRVALQLTDDGGVAIQGSAVNVLISESDESVTIRMEDSSAGADGGEARTFAIPLTRVELTDPLAWRRPPSSLSSRRRWQVLAVAAGAWLGLLIVVWMTPLRRNRLGTILIAFALLANAGGICWLLPRLG